MRNPRAISWQDAFTSAGLDALAEDREHLLGKAMGAALGGSVEPSLVAEFVREAGLAPRLCLQALRDAVRSEANVSAGVVDAVRAAIPLFETSLDAATCPEERAEVREQILTLIRQARDEATEHRRFMIGLGKVTAIVAVATVSAISLWVSGGNGRGRT